MENSPTPDNRDKHNALLKQFNEAKNKELRSKWQEKTENLDMEKDTTKLWKLAKALNEDREPPRKATTLLHDGNHYSGKMAANILADYYQDIGKNNVPATRIKEVRTEIRRQKKLIQPTEEMNAMFDLSELDAALLQLGYKRAPGKDGVLNEMLTNIGPITKDKLLLIINQSWESGKFPDSWREAVIIPIPKPSKDNSTQLTVERFRPISLLSVIGKLMERMVNNRLIAYLERNKLLNHSQTAYRRNLSTEDQLALIAQEIENAFQDKMNTVAMFVDLTKAFDKMWRQGLLLKLLYKKISGKMYDWIKDFLRYRTARVRVDGKLSHRVQSQKVRHKEV